MADTPKENEVKYKRFLSALKTLAPNAVFGGVKLPEFEAQTNKSESPRANLERIEDEKVQEETSRTNEDVVTMKMCEMIKNGVIADPDFGDNSALYEALGYIPKSAKKSGLTRKKTEPKRG